MEHKLFRLAVMVQVVGWVMLFVALAAPVMTQESPPKHVTGNDEWICPNTANRYMFYERLGSYGINCQNLIAVADRVAPDGSTSADTLDTSRYEDTCFIVYATSDAGNGIPDTMSPDTKGVRVLLRFNGMNLSVDYIQNPDFRDPRLK